MDKFTRRVLNYCKLNPESAKCAYYIKFFEDSKKAQSAERKRWRLIRDELLSKAPV
jgi:hypothetical protein